MGYVPPSQLLFLLPTAVRNGPPTVQRAGDVLMRVGNQSLGDLTKVSVMSK